MPVGSWAKASPLLDEVLRVIGEKGRAGGIGFGLQLWTKNIQTKDPACLPCGDQGEDKLGITKHVRARDPDSNFCVSKFNFVDSSF